MGRQSCPNGSERGPARNPETRSLPRMKKRGVLKLLLNHMKRKKKRKKKKRRKKKRKSKFGFPFLDLSRLVQTCPNLSRLLQQDLEYELPFFRFLCDIHISISHIHTFLLCNNYQFCLISYTPVLKSRVLHYLDIGQNIFTFKTAHL